MPTTPKTADASMPYDQNQDPIQVLGIDESSVGTMAVGAASTRINLPGGAGDVFELSLLEDAYVAFGGAAITATTSSRLLNKGTYVYRRLDGQTDVAALRVATSGTLTVAVMR